MALEAVIWDFGGVFTSSPFEAFNRLEAEMGELTGRQLEWFDSHLGIKREKPVEVKAASSGNTK